MHSEPESLYSFRRIPRHDLTNFFPLPDNDFRYGLLRDYIAQAMEGKKVLRINDNKSISLLLFEFVHRYWSNF